VKGTRCLSILNAKIGSYSSGAYDLLIWDCDGVLVDSEYLLKKGEVDALAQLGFKLTADDCTRMFSGVSVDEAQRNFKLEMKASLPSDFFKKQVEQSMDLFRRELQPLMKNTVCRLHENKVPMCVASGSPRPRVLVSLEVGGMSHCFKADEVFTREQVARGKPAPDLFLYSAEKMNVKASRCVVVEDSNAGIEAAIAAGMPVIAYLGGGHAKASWYREKILSSYKVPTAFTQEEVLALLL